MKNVVIFLVLCAIAYYGWCKFAQSEVSVALVEQTQNVDSLKMSEKKELWELNPIDTIIDQDSVKIL